MIHCVTSTREHWNKAIARGFVLTMDSVENSILPPSQPLCSNCIENDCSSSMTFSLSESIIYTVQPRMGSPALLATPNWPNGMKPYSTVSWIVNLPGHLQANLLFTNISQPKCGQGHTCIKVQTLDSPEELLSQREDEAAEDKLMVPESFYLNMSNCLPEDRHFSVLSKVTLQNTSSKDLFVMLLWSCDWIMVVIRYLHNSRIFLSF